MGRKRKSDSLEPEDRKNSSKKAATGGGSIVGRVDILRSNTANERERARMRVLSKAFVRLKTSLPWVPPDTKLSKLDTLRLASRYIAHLRRLLTVGGEGVTESTGDHRLLSAGDQDGGGQLRTDFQTASEYERMLNPEDIHPINLSWPFTSNLRKSALQSQSVLRTTTTTSTTSSSLAPSSSLSSTTTTTTTPVSSASPNVSSTGGVDGALPFP